MNKQHIYESIMNNLSKSLLNVINEQYDFDEDGWDEYQLNELIDVLAELYNLNYEIKNSRRGCFTGAHTYEELADHVRKLGEQLVDLSNDVRYCKDPEIDPDDYEDED